MTAIAYKDGVMAADSGSFSGGFWTASQPKIRRLDDGSLVGLAGWKPVIARALLWVDSVAQHKTWDDPWAWPALPREGEEVNDLDLIIVRNNGEIWNFCRKFEFFRADNQEFAVAGSHFDFMVGAMCAGASAEGAVDLAIMRTTTARPPRISVNLSD